MIEHEAGSSTKQCDKEEYGTRSELSAATPMREKDCENAKQNVKETVPLLAFRVRPHVALACERNEAGPLEAFGREENR